MITIEQEFSWDEIIHDLVVVSERDKVRIQSRDDFDLGPGWVFAGGKMVDGEWFSSWAQIETPVRDVVVPWLSGGLGSVEFRLWESDGRWHMVGNSANYIGGAIITLTDAPPGPLQQFFGR
jgi:hypothetical protein